MDASNTVKSWRPNCTGMGFTDEQFVVGNGKSRKIFHVHKSVILSSGIPNFQQIYSEDLTNKADVIEIDEDPELFEVLMNHLYGKHKITSLRSFWNLFVIANKYQLPTINDIIKKYENVYMPKITEDEFWDGIENSEFSHPFFRNKMLAYLKKYTDILLLSERFLNVPECFVEKLVQMDELFVDECNLLLAVTEWAYYKFKYPNPEYLLKFYKHIRFSNLTYDDYFEFLEKYPYAIEAKSSLQILQYLHSPFTHSLPNWCSSSEVLRKDEYLEEEKQLNYSESFE